MNELETLYRLQELDTRIAELREREESHPLKSELQDIEEKREAAYSGLEEATAQMEESRKRLAAMEEKIRAVDEKLSREESKLYDGKVTNPKELRGLEAEVRSLKRKKDELETEELEEMEAQDVKKEELEALQSVQERLLAEIEEKRGILENETREIRSQLAEVEGERERLRSQVGGELLEIYDGLLESKHNLAVVKVIDGVCQGCRVELPGREFDRFLKSEGVFNCSNCGRILVK